MLDAVRHYFSFRDLLLNLAFLAFLVLAWFVPRFGDGIFRPVERYGTLLARKKSRSILCIALLPVALRLSFLWLAPVPVPHTHDEFSYLLAGQTFAHARLTNPPHAMWVFLDTIHVNQHPTYMSKYPPAQGFALGLGEILGNPWIGVIISVSGMCAAVLWMLQGWLPARWALLGAILAVLRLGVFSYWMNSYWGGALPAIGGALVVGALPRILRSWHPRDALLLGLGAAILMNSRPLEGLFLSLPVAVVLMVRLAVGRTPAWGVLLRGFFVPLSLVVAASAIFICYYNWRGTGKPFVLPYLVNERTYVSTPTLLWQKARPPIPFVNPQFTAFYNVWARDQWMQGRSNSLGHLAKHISLDIAKFVNFFLWPELCLPFLALPWILRDRKMRFLLLQTAICFSGFLMVAWFQPHYAAPLTATVFVLLVQGIRHLRRWEWRGRPVGIALTRVVVVFAIILSPFHPHAAALGREEPVGIENRARIEAQLEANPGNHLVLVRYSPRHDVLAEWVYNRADVDNAKVVWARAIPGVDLAPLLNYFHGRQVWIVEADDSTPRLTPYRE